MQHFQVDEVEAFGDALAGASVRDLRAVHQASGFPSPVRDDNEDELNVRDLLMRRPAATCFLRMEGDAMRDLGISAGDILVIDRARTPRLGGIIVAAVDDELLVRRYWPSALATYLIAAHPDYSPIRIPAEAACQVWGVVTHAIHQ